MRRHKISIVIFFLPFFIGFLGCRQANTTEDYLLSFSDTINDTYGYKDQKGDTIIPLGKYTMCFTDTLRTYAFVLKAQSGFVAIDRNENFLYKVFPFDNGPDYASDGTFRIVENNKIGFADSASGKIIIQPQFDCAFPFENGRAKVSTDCKSESDDEHAAWLSDHWYYIDKTGKKVD